MVLAGWARDAARLGTALPVGKIVSVNCRPGDPRLFRSLEGAVWDGIAELVVHPADSLDGLQSLTKLLETRLDEYTLFSASEVPEKFADIGIDLVSFAAVAAATGEADGGLLH
jgi:hypothetical protein